MSTDTVTVEPGQSVATETTIPRRDASVMELAAVIAGSRDFPDCRTPEKAAVRILAGKEMGVGPIASVIGIRVQNGRVSMDATLMAGCIKRSGRYDYKITAHTNDVCALVFFENGQPAGESAFSMADAEKAGLAKKDTWRGYPRNMLFARALSNGARWYCPAIFGGSIYTHEELGYAVDEEGRAVDANGNGGGCELCTREQRQEISRLWCGCLHGNIEEYKHSLGIKLLDELSQAEAAKEIKKIQKIVDKKTATPTAPGSADANTAGPALSSDRPLTEAQKTMQEGFDESRAPSTPLQHKRIKELVTLMFPGDGDVIDQERYETLTVALKKRNCQRLADLNYLQASALIELINNRIAAAAQEAAELPFDPTIRPNVGVDPAKLPPHARGSKPK